MKRANRKCSNSNIPLELCSEILTYLNVKSLLQFRSVSKSWKSIIEDPYFSRRHLKNCPNNFHSPYLIFSETPSPRGSSTRLVLRRSTTYRRAAALNIFQFPSSSIWELCSVLDGLILLLGGYETLESKQLENRIILWNPSIRKAIYLPPPPMKQSEPYPFKELKIHLCLLRDEPNDDYKVVMLCHHRYILRTDFTPIVNVFSLKSRSWRRVVDHTNNNGDTVSTTFIINTSFGIGSSACIGGSAHWIGQDYPLSLTLMSFNLTCSNKLSYTPLPLDTDSSSPTAVQVKLIILCRCTLGFLAQFGTPNQSIIIWAMNETPSSASSALDNKGRGERCWTKRYQIHTAFDFPHIFCVRLQERDVLLLSRSRTLDSYSLNDSHDEEEFKRLLTYYKCKPNYIAPYVESLLLLEYNAVPSVGGGKQILQSPQLTGDFVLVQKINNM